MGGATVLQVAMEESFYLSNISPQTPDFNRGYWLKLERHVRALLKQYKELYVYSGCLYIPIEEIDGKRYVKYQVIGMNDIAVPTHYFKVIFTKEKGDLVEAYVMPNESIDLDKPLEDFIGFNDIFKHIKNREKYASNESNSLKMIYLNISYKIKYIFKCMIYRGI